MISIVIPVKNGGPGFRRCLASIAAQQIREDVELVVVDSGSTDGSLEAARAAGATVIEIPSVDFTHGGSRNIGARAAQGDLLVFTSQDAYAENDSWLATLRAAVVAAPTPAGVYGRQLPHHDARPPEQYFLGFLYGDTARDQHAPQDDELSMRTTLFSNVNSAIPKAIWKQFPFVDDIIMSEDQEWAVRVLRAGHFVRYEPRAAVRHSHHYTPWTAFQRFFDSGVSAGRTYLAGGPSSTVLRNEAVAYARGETAWLWQTYRAWLPYAALYESAKLLGLQLGAHHRRLPRWLKRRLSAHAGYWENV